MRRVSQVLAAGGSWRRFWWHYLQMVLAMTVGMALAPLAGLLFGLGGGAAVYGRPDVHTLVMATAMTTGMSVWMWFLGHNWRPVVEMAAAMFAPYVTLFPLLWAGLIDGAVLTTVGHVVMLPAMFAVMLQRPAEYMLPNVGQGSASARPTPKISHAATSSSRGVLPSAPARALISDPSTTTATDAWTPTRSPKGLAARKV